MKLEIRFPLRAIAIDTDAITIGRVKKLQQCLNKVKLKHEPLTQYPFKSDIEVLNDEGNPTGETRIETFDEWKTRVLSDKLDQTKKLNDETDDHYDQRILEMAMSDHVTAIAFDFLVEVCHVFKLQELTKDEFEEASWEKVRNFCFDLLQNASITDPQALFFPPTRADSMAERLPS